MKIRALSIAAAAALTIGMASAAMAQEGPSNDTETGTTWPPPLSQLQGQPQGQSQPGMVQSGSSDVQRSTTTTGRPFWTPGVED